MTIKIATQVLRVVERELAVGYSVRESINRAAADLGIAPARVVAAMQWGAVNY